MSVGSITIPSYSQGDDLDFSRLSQLPQVWRQAQRDALTLANIERLRAAQQLSAAINEDGLAGRRGADGRSVDPRQIRMLQGGVATPVFNAQAARADAIPATVGDRFQIWSVGP
ncbi:hypothetical protein [Bradyrhizobium sp. LHD-71]|uniref:hypothetical protein n=1 Tax=Bradyrhizobium sp. LHD-71 TaxID=3072141 RepID=UPI00280D04E0|nr:hypothetical protein [Bradyrhizobium sp. LHD-71]MDQ8730503.1 hypothetical protein [Bradyrhizobium sp. LHD-71]